MKESVVEPTAPQWSRTPPTVPGWYWVRGVRHRSEPEPALVTDYGSVWLGQWEDSEPLGSAYFVAAEWWPMPLEAPV